MNTGQTNGRTPEDLSQPFELSIDTDPDCRPVLSFARTLRWLPGKRLVGAGTWGEKPVLIKLFYGRNARKYWRREDRGTRILESSAAEAPRILYSGLVRNRDWHIVISEWISEARTFYSAWHDAADDLERIHLARLLTGHIASHHRSGVLQQDMHLNNFLLSDGVVYSIDGARVKAADRLTTAGALRNLSLLFALLPPRLQPSIPDLVQHYLRTWPNPAIGERQEKLLSLTARARARIIRRHLKKVVRNCTAIKVDRHPPLRRIFFRDDEGTDPGRELVPDRIAQPLPEDRILKAGNSSTVWAGELGGRHRTFKRYNVKGLLHGIKLALRKSRALKSWLNAHRLMFHGINTPPPVAAIVEKRLLVSGRAWYISHFVEAPDAASFFSFNRALSPRETVVARNMCGLIALLGACRLSHGDLKASNILIRDGEPFIIDLDAVRAHTTRWMARRSHQKDLRRFLANWQEQPVLRRQFEDILRELGEADW